MTWGSTEEQKRLFRMRVTLVREFINLYSCRPSINSQGYATIFYPYVREDGPVDAIYIPFYFKNNRVELVNTFREGPHAS